MEDLLNSWSVVLDENNHVLINGNNIVLKKKGTMEIGYIENTEENAKLLGISIVSPIYSTYDEPSTSQSWKEKEMQELQDGVSENEAEDHFEGTYNLDEIETDIQENKDLEEENVNYRFAYDNDQVDMDRWDSSKMYKIREALRDFPEVEIGTTEAFQGREKRVMIISTVRAQEDLLLHDQKYKLGFVNEPQRFNVAITRAKSKLIVIGNPLVLSKDDKWLQLINQAKVLGTRCGAPYPERDQADIDGISKRFRNFHMKDDIKPKQR